MYKARHKDLYRQNDLDGYLLNALVINEHKRSLFQLKQYIFPTQIPINHELYNNVNIGLRLKFPIKGYQHYDYSLAVFVMKWSDMNQKKDDKNQMKLKCYYKFTFINLFVPHQ